MVRRLVRPTRWGALAPKRPIREYLADHPSLDNGIFYGLCVVLALVIATAFILDNRYHVPPRDAANVATRIDVPDVRGMAASDARALLERVGLRFARAEVAVGTPGQVQRTRPGIGRPVPPNTAVTVFVGVDPARMHVETNRP